LPVFDREQLFIGGQWVAPAGTGTFEVVCPSTEELVARVPEGTTADIDRAVAAARRSFDDGTWRSTAPAERAAVLRRMSRAISERADELAKVITTEMGAPIASALADQVMQPVATIDYYASMADSYPFEEARSVGRTTTVVHEPVGVVAAIVPWNAPLRSIINKLAPALLAGCSVVVKPAPNTPLSANVLAEVLAVLDLPEGVVSIVPAGREVGEHLVGHRLVDKVAFTGSTIAGRRIMGAAAEHLTRVSLELGGKSAAIVLDDADLSETLKRLVPLAIGNTGQACTAMTRVLVSRARHDEFIDALCGAVAKWPPGDPFDPTTRTGPLVSTAQLERVMGYLDLARQEGTTTAIGGGRPSNLERGYFVEPTVLTGVTNDMRIAQEEIFGPVVAVIAYDDVDDAVAIANDSAYGLSGSVWTTDIDLGVDVARRIRTGQVRVNGAALATDAPFGGFKQSGMGREYGPEGLASFLESKAIAFRPSR
jgi:aldehyde dehydrogenase (NAD+)